MKPIVIRAHHLFTFDQVLRNDEKWNPVEMAKRQTESLGKLFSENTEWARFYAPDVLGTPENSAPYQAGIEAVLRWWRDAPPDHPVEVVECQKDDICALCAIGNHCQLRINPEHNLDNMRYEAMLLTALIKALSYWKEIEHTTLKEINHAIKDDTGIVGPEILVEPIRFVDTREVLGGRRLRTNKKAVWLAVKNNWIRHYDPSEYKEKEPK
jgi:hypothetical protein